MEIFILFKEDR